MNIMGDWFLVMASGPRRQSYADLVRIQEQCTSNSVFSIWSFCWDVTALDRNKSNGQQVVASELTYDTPWSQKDVLILVETCERSLS